MANRKALYTAAKHGMTWQAEVYIVAKFDVDTRFQEASYEIVKTKRGLMCNCPCGLNNKHRTCRHRLILTAFKHAKALGSERLYDFDTKQFVGESA